MPMLGFEPWSVDGKTFIRKSLAVPQGMQSFWTSRDGGMCLAVDHIGNPRPELIEQGCDTLVLNPMDYEAVKKSMMETPRRDRAREFRRRGYGDLRNFDAEKHFEDRAIDDAEKRKDDRKKGFRL